MEAVTLKQLPAKRRKRKKKKKRKKEEGFYVKSGSAVSFFSPPTLSPSVALLLFRNIVYRCVAKL